MFPQCLTTWVRRLGSQAGVTGGRRTDLVLVKGAKRTWNRGVPVPELTALRAVMSVSVRCVSICHPSNPCAPEHEHRVFPGGGGG